MIIHIRALSAACLLYLLCLRVLELWIFKLKYLNSRFSNEKSFFKENNRIIKQFMFLFCSPHIPQESKIQENLRNRNPVELSQ